MENNVGDNFQSTTKYERHKMTGGYLDWANKPDTYKHYPNNKTVKLPFSKQFQTLSFDETIQTRKSIRSFSEKNLNLEQLAYLLWTSTGIQRKQNGYQFRNAPSAGALYPIETYLFAKKVDELPVGLYHYNIQSHGLEELKTRDFSTNLTKSCLGQSMLSDAAVVIVWSAVFDRSKWKYKQRAYRYIYLDCGHIAQNLALTATNIGLGTCQIGAFYDNEINALLDLDGTKESTIYLSAVGYPL